RISMREILSPPPTFRLTLYTLAGGTWQMKTKKGYVCERWTKTSVTELRSIGFKVIGADTIIEEKSV
ncbi:MAG: hypothetical protein V4560_09985, partial [Bacteroidota bacterium]